MPTYLSGHLNKLTAKVPTDKAAGVQLEIVESDGSLHSDTQKSGIMHERFGKFDIKVLDIQFDGKLAESVKYTEKEDGTGDHVYKITPGRSFEPSEVTQLFKALGIVMDIEFDDAQKEIKFPKKIA